MKKAWTSAGKFLTCLSFLMALCLGSGFSLRGEDVKVMTANLVSGGWPNIYYFSYSRRIFQGLNPDIVLVQEFRVNSGSLRSYVDEVFGTNFSLIYSSGSSPNGIISRWPFKDSGQWDDTQLSDREFAWAVIDIPGPIDLQAVSVHLKAGSSSAEKATRTNEANQIKTYVHEKFDNGQYILVGGDLNTYSPSEGCLGVFTTFLDYNDHVPVDGNGNSNTNEGRTERYDWLMPNTGLDGLHNTTTVGTQKRPYPEGIVFDSWVFPNVAAEVPPVRYSDSHAPGMDHMGVMKTFKLFEHGLIVEEGFDGFQTGVRPLNWTFYGCDQDSDAIMTQGDYGEAAPSIGLYGGGDAITTAPFANPISLTFWVGGVSYDTTSTLLVERHYDGNWFELSTLLQPPYTHASAYVGPFDLDRTVDQLRFTRIEPNPSSNAYIALDDVLVVGITPSPAPSPSPSPTSPPLPDRARNLDFNGDGTSDIAIFRGIAGLWGIRGITRVYFGGSADYTVPGDYDGNGTTDIGIFRPAAGLWAVRGVTRSYFGGASSEPVPGDYNGDGVTDIGIFRPSSGLWAVRGGLRIYFGGSLDLPVPGYYDGDATEEIAVFRPASGLWAIPGITRIYFGGSNDDPVPGDYSGSGSWSVGIYRPAAGLWAVRGVTRRYFGVSTDYPVPGDYSGSGADSIGIFRPSGLWAIQGLPRVYFGSSGDIPVAR